MKYLRGITKLLSIASYVIIIIYALVYLPGLFGVRNVIIDYDSQVYTKNSIVYYYKTDIKNIGSGDIITYKKNNKILTGNVISTNGNEIKVKSDNSDETVSYNNVLGKNVSIIIKALGSFIMFINKNFVLAAIVLFGIIILNLIINIVYKNKTKEENIEDKKEIIENINTEDKKEENLDIKDKKEEIVEEKVHKKVLEIDE